MTLARFARLCETIEEMTPTGAIAVLSKSWNEFEDKVILTKILNLDFEMNNLGNKKATKWIAKSFGVFDAEIEEMTHIHCDLADGVYFFDEAREHSKLSLRQFYNVLELNCSQIDGRSFSLFDELFIEMSPLEKKWFVRYWVRTPRMGMQHGNLIKTIAKVYDKKVSVVKRHQQFNTPAEIVEAYESGIDPETNLTFGSFVTPMLAKAAPKSKWPVNYILEYKYDGARYQIHKKDDSVIIFNRKGKVVNPQFQDIVEMVLEWPNKHFIIDTEIYPVDDEGKPAPFRRLGTRIHSKDHQKAATECPVRLAVFDVFLSGSQTTIEQPLALRLDAMQGFPNLAESSTGSIKEFYSIAIAEGYEGIMIKNLNAPYRAGKRSLDWVKYKPPRIELDVVITGARYGDGKRSNVFASFDIAVMNNGNFDQIGSIGTGFSDADFTFLTSKLRPLTTSLKKDTYEVLPRVVMTVFADLITENRDGTYALRFPRMKTLRDDKSANEIDTMETVMGLV